ncbi:hypothetical protein DL96DRAFT_1819076 [Flagelloscypha sp. PMI_526]|nr:hypothetical protein DL96DRAFT_1819076 [Flagelloscypha sp. PMI_526]
MFNPKQQLVWHPRGHNTLPRRPDIHRNTVGSALSTTWHFLYRTANTLRHDYSAKSLQPLPIDVARNICEYAAALDKETARSLYSSSKNIREWVTPFLFRSIEIQSYSTLMRVKAPDVLQRVAPHVYEVSLRPNIPDWGSSTAQISLELTSFLNALPNLAHFVLPHISSESIWHKVPIFLPPCVTSLDTTQHFIEYSDRRLASSTRLHVTHLVSCLRTSFKTDAFLKWPYLTHLFFEINPREYMGNSIAQATFPVKALPPSIVSCVLMQAKNHISIFRWSIDEYFVDLVLGDTDPRVVFAVHDIRARWLAKGELGMAEANPPQDYLRRIITGLQDAIVFHECSNHPISTIWANAEWVRRRRRDLDVRAAAHSLLSSLSKAPSIV